MKTIIRSLCLFIFLILTASTTLAGTTFNAFTGKLDIIPTITETDGSPSIAGCKTIKFANTNVTDNADGTCSVADATGAGGGDEITVNTTAATNANFLDNLYTDWAINTAATPDDITSKFNYAETLAGNPALLTTEVVFTADGLLAEGTTADTIEMKLAFPDPATTDKTVTLPNATDTLVGKDTTDTLTNKTLAAASNVIDADTGDSATSFFSSGTLEVAIGGTGTTTSTGTGAVVLGTSPTITTSLVTSTPTTLAVTELDRLDGLAGVIVTDTTSTTEIDGRGLTISAGTLVADAELYTDTKCIWWEYPTAADDFKSIWYSVLPVTLTKIWAESDQTVTFMLQIDDGSPADVDSVDLAPAAGTATDTSLDGDATMATGDRLDMAVTSVANIPTWVSVCWEFTKDD